MTTVARTFAEKTAQFYMPNGDPLYEVPYADPSKGMRRATLADARKVGALPGVTAILRCLARPELQNWITEQAVLAVLTSPRKKDPATGEFEADDVFVHRVLQVEKVQEQERDLAADLGHKLHELFTGYFRGEEVKSSPLWPRIEPAVKAVAEIGNFVASEKVLIGEGYGGRTDLILETDALWWMWDIKTTKTLPKPDKSGKVKAWDEHVLQLAAYAAALWKSLKGAGMTSKPIRTANCYVSTVETGKYVLAYNPPDWEADYRCFEHILRVWQYLNKYCPQETAAVS